MKTSDMPFLASGGLLQNVNHSPLWTEKDTIIVQYYGVFLLSSDNALYIAIARLLYRVIATKTLVFAPNTKNRSVVSVYRIHSKNSKVVHHPKNHPIFTPKVVIYPKFTHKNIPKVVTTCK